MKKFVFALALATLQLFIFSEASAACKSRLGTVPEGGQLIGYPSPIGTKNDPCMQDVLICRNGQLSGPDLYRTCVDEQEQPIFRCWDGDTLTGYASPYAPCYPTTAVCINGKFNKRVYFSCR